MSVLYSLPGVVYNITMHLSNVAQKSKDCNMATFIGARVHMHNCPGKCCSQNRDGTDGYKCDGVSQTYCGYCFNKFECKL